LEAYYVQIGLDDSAAVVGSNHAPFDDKPRVRRTGAKVISSATSMDEARRLEDQGCDAIVVQGYEAGGHRGMFLTQNVFTQVGTMALVPQGKSASHRRRGDRH
jgi:nitronate monooxygenase